MIAGGRESATAHPAPPIPLAQDSRSRSNFACSNPSMLRRHSSITAFKTRSPSIKSACLIPSTRWGANA
jgi:hypothetical protein